MVSGNSAIALNTDKK